MSAAPPPGAAACGAAPAEPGTGAQARPRTAGELTAALAGRPLRAVLHAAAELLAAAGCDTPRLDAELFAADALGVERASLLLEPDRSLDAGSARSLAARLERRAEREPVAYVLGRRGFRRLELAVDRRVLVPRPETELLVELALELPRTARVHEVGTGSGAVALALLDERPDLNVSASDASPAALEVARANAARLGLALELTLARGLPASAGRPDLVLANLPYVRAGEWPLLAPEITCYEPREALVAGEDGLDALRELIAAAPAGTRLALEHAPGQAPAVRELLRAAETHRDLAGRERVTVGIAV